MTGSASSLNHSKLVPFCGFVNQIYLSEIPQYIAVVTSCISKQSLYLFERVKACQQYDRLEIYI